MKDSIFRYEYIMLVILSFTGGIFLVSAAEGALGNGALYAFLAAFAPGIAINCGFLALLKRNSFGTLGDINAAVFGGAGRVITFIYGAYFLLSAALLLNYYGIFTTDLLLPVPLAAFIVPICAAVALAAMKGVMTMGRMAVCFSVVLIGCVAVSFLLELPYAKAENLAPASFSADFPRMAAFFALTQFADMAGVLYLSSFVKEKKGLFKWSVISAIIGGGIVVLFMLLSAAALGGTLAGQYSGFYRVMKIVNLGTLINRLEALVMAGYFFATVFRVMISFFSACKNIKDSVFARKDINVKRHEVITAVCAGAFLCLFSIFFNSTKSGAEEFLTGGYLCIASAAALLPIVTLLVQAAKKAVKRKTM